MDNNKINKSYLTTEAKDDINEMLGRGGESGGSSFTSQVETTEGLTLGKGTEDEESLTANELKTIKNSGNEIVYVANNSNDLDISAGGITETGKISLSGLISNYDLSGGHYKVIPFSLMGSNFIVVSAQIYVMDDEMGEIGQTNAIPNYESASDCYAYIKLYNPTNATITLRGQYFGFLIVRSANY